MPGALTRWDPFGELRHNGDLVVRADIPGIKPEEVKIEVEDDVLTVSGEHEEEKEEMGKQFVRRERRYGAFSRSMALPSGVDASKIVAKTKDGVVEVTIPLPNEAKEETITITPTAS